MYEKIKQWYKQGLWSKFQVQNALSKNVITQEQYNEIVEEA